MINIGPSRKGAGRLLLPGVRGDETGTTQINGWTLTFDLKSGGVRLGDTRNGRWSIANGRVTVRSLDQNAAIAPGATVASRPTASLNGRSGRRDRVPERFTLNGTNCQILDAA
jgi:hypothetical protein